MVVQPNRGHPKVGALYAAHNAGLAAAHGRYRYVSFLQGDMQVMRWPKSMPETIDALFSLTSDKVFCVTTTFPSRGAIDSFKRSHKSPPDQVLKNGQKYVIISSQPCSDVGIYSVRLMESIGFRFREDEGALSKKIGKLGFVAAGLRQPNLASVPWPGSVRKGSPRGSDPRTEDPFLRMGFPTQDDSVRQANDSGISWQENCVVPNGYRTLYPYWPTDIVRPKWIARRISITRKMGLGFWTAIDSEGSLGSFLRPSPLRRHPSLPYLLFRLVTGTPQLIRPVVGNWFDQTIKQALRIKRNSTRQ